MKKKRNLINKENEAKNLIEDKYYSKIIKHIDDELIFNKRVKKIKLIKNSDKLFKYNDILQKEKNNNKKYNSFKENNNYNKYNDGNISLNRISRLKRLSYLPKISPYIYNNKTSISIDYNKASEMGAKGFSKLCNNESNSIKEILFEYNDHNFSSYEDYISFFYFNKVNEKLKNNIKNEINNNAKEDEKNIPNLYNKYDDGNEIKNIFDKNYIEKKKISKLNELFKNKIERIKTQNKKVDSVLEQYKKKYFNKEIDNRIYKINYNSIQKHIPYALIDNKSKRIFPENLINNNFNITTMNNNLSNSIKRNLSNRIDDIKLKKKNLIKINIQV